MADSNPPRTGKALFLWAKEQEQIYGIALTKYLMGWGKLQEFPAPIVNWDAEQVAEAYEELQRKLGRIREKSARIYAEATGETNDAI